MMLRLFSLTIFFLFLSCTNVRYVEVPVKSVEYRNRLTIDTVLKNDSIIVKNSNDTIFFEKYKYVYKTKNIRDTVIVKDTITVVNEIEVVKETNKLRFWQIVLMCAGGAGIILLSSKIIRIARKILTLWTMKL